MGIVTNYLKKIIARQVEDHHLVVWFDPEGHYTQVTEVLELPGTTVACYRGSFFALCYEIESLIESLMGNLDPPKLLIYVPLAEEETLDALVAETSAGVVLKPGQHPWLRNTRLSVIARHALKQVIGENAAGMIEKQVEAGKLSLAELDKLAEKGEGFAGGVVSAIFDTGDPPEVALAFLSSEQRDQAIVNKKAIDEVALLLGSAFEVELPPEKSPEAYRACLSRHILATAFIMELQGAIPEPLATVKVAKQGPSRQACLSLAKIWRLRGDLRESYVKWASWVEKELELNKITFGLNQISSSETFLAGERSLQEIIEGELLTRARPEIIEIAKKRQSSFWAGQVPEVQARWALIVAAGQLLLEAGRISAEIKGISAEPKVTTLVHAYATTGNPWCLLDTLHRHLEQRYHNFDFSPVDSEANLEKLIIMARQCYMEVGSRLAEHFVHAFCNNHFKLPGFLHQIEIYKTLVAPAVKEGKTAYVLVDALRFEMARELTETLSENFDVFLQPAIAAVPSITEVGMAALMPHADTGASLVVVDKSKLGLKIEETLLKDRPSRVKFLNARAGGQVCDLKMDDLLPTPRKKVHDAVAEAQLIFITSQEIDALCEGDNISLARRVMDDVLHQLRRVFRILGELKIKTIILTADHGYLFGEELDSDMKVTTPGGETLDLHRRVWVGRGGSADPSYIRATTGDFGFGGDLEIAVPLGWGAFKVQGGTRAYFHGGLSPQEIIIPVAKLIPKTSPEMSLGKDITWTLLPGSKKISTRFFSVQIQGRADSLFEITSPKVRVEIRAKSEIISVPVASSYGFQDAVGDVQLRLAGDDNLIIEPNTVTLMLTKEPDQKTVAVYLLDAASGRALARLENIEVAIAI